ncbi:MAG: glucan biosynthesis protein, partial [Gammaproteobacteria bacterium]|nr:glucan biosynthesis protein [Gammaproteobacteria bacterium]
MRWVLFALGIFGATAAPYVSARGLDFNGVIAKAKALAAKPYQPPKPVPEFLQQLSFSQYQAIRFNPQRSLWRGGHSRFQVMLVSPGLYYTHAVKINVIDAAGVHPVPYRKNDFSFPGQDVEKRVPADL